MKLELKHLAPYLPYGIRVRYYWNGEINEAELNAFNIDLPFLNAKQLKDYKPILRPLSDLTKEIEYVKGKPLKAIEVITHPEVMLKILDNNSVVTIDFLPFMDIETLFQWHFDVFGLIDKGLAIDINTINP